MARTFSDSEQHNATYGENAGKKPKTLHSVDAQRGKMRGNDSEATQAWQDT